MRTSAIRRRGLSVIAMLGAAGLLLATATQAATINSLWNASGTGTACGAAPWSAFAFGVGYDSSGHPICSSITSGNTVSATCGSGAANNQVTRLNSSRNFQAMGSYVTWTTNSTAALYCSVDGQWQGTASSWGS